MTNRAFFFNLELLLFHLKCKVSTKQLQLCVCVCMWGGIDVHRLESNFLFVHYFCRPKWKMYNILFFFSCHVSDKFSAFP
jgi:hypothetical protein